MATGRGQRAALATGPGVAARRKHGRPPRTRLDRSAIPRRTRWVRAEMRAADPLVRRHSRVHCSGLRVSGRVLVSVETSESQRACLGNPQQGGQIVRTHGLKFGEIDLAVIVRVGDQKAQAKLKCSYPPRKTRRGPLRNLTDRNHPVPVIVLALEVASGVSVETFSVNRSAGLGLREGIFRAPTPVRRCWHRGW